MLPGKGYWLVQRHASRPAMPMSCESQTEHCAVETGPLWHNRTILLTPTFRVVGWANVATGAKAVDSQSRIHSAAQFVDVFAPKKPTRLSAQFTGVPR